MSLSLLLVAGLAQASEGSEWQVFAEEHWEDGYGKERSKLNRTLPVTVARTVLPEHPDPTDAEERVCRVALVQAHGGWSTTVKACPEPFLGVTKAAVRQWTLKGPSELRGPEVTFYIRYTVADGAAQVRVVVPSEQLPEDVELPAFLEPRGTVLRPRRRVAPKYPTEATRRGLGEQVCLAKLTANKRGKPTRVEVSGCDGAFVPAVEKAMMRWRFYPYRVDGEAMPFTFTIPVRFKPL